MGKQHFQKNYIFTIKKKNSILRQMTFWLLKSSFLRLMTLRLSKTSLQNILLRLFFIYLFNLFYFILFFTFEKQRIKAHYILTFKKLHFKKDYVLTFIKSQRWPQNANVNTMIIYYLNNHRMQRDFHIMKKINYSLFLFICPEFTTILWLYFF